MPLLGLHFVRPQFTRGLVSSHPFASCRMIFAPRHATIQIMANSQSRAIEQTIFPNGLVVMSDSMPHVRSVSVGIWIRSGSRREPADLNGISHFIEHIV